jgi:hypothetical protein
MRKALVLLGLTAGVAVIGLVAYATTGGVAVETAAGVDTQARPAPVCVPGTATEGCPSAASCHDGRMTCPPSCRDCPDFKDNNGDGVCDVVSDCGRHGRSGGCAGGDARRGHGDHGRGCWHSR